MNIACPQRLHAWLSGFKVQSIMPSLQLRKEIMKCVELLDKSFIFCVIDIIGCNNSTRKESNKTTISSRGKE